MKTLILLLILGLIVAGCTNTTTTQSNVQENVSATAGQKTITFAEVSKHNSEQDCWVIIKGNVLNLTGFASKHAGGAAYVPYCGKDATEAFVNKPHSEKAESYFTYFMIGKLQN